jgi:hypothetical protein
VDAREGILYESVTDALLTLGDSTRNAFIWQLKKNGAHFSPHRVDLRAIEMMLFQYFGDAAHSIVERICNSFARKALVSGYFRVASESNEQTVVTTRAVELFLQGRPSDRTAD